MNDPALSPIPARRVAVVGLGAMGTALARTLVDDGHDTVVWNRSPKNLNDLGLGDARLAPLATDAVRDADAVIVCVRDHHASRPLIEQIADAVSAGTPIVNLTTGTSEHTVESAAHAAALGLRYLTGAIMVPTSLIGTDDNLVLYAGAPADLAAARPVLDALGGTVDFLGDDHALPPVFDMAMLDVFFAGMYAFLHSAAMVRAHGVEPTAYLPYATGITTTLMSSLPELAAAFEGRKYDGGEARLDMCLSFLDHIVATSEAAGVDPSLPGVIRDATRAQAALGFGALDWDRVAEGLTTAPR